MSISAIPADAAQWFATPLGQYALARETEYFDRVVADLFGYNAFQLGLPEHDLLRANRIPLRCRVAPSAAVGVRADFRDLPIASNCADLMVLPHVLEFSDHPHQILREVTRVLRPEGHVLITCFNPWSLWGARRTFSRRDEYPWHGRFINLPRLKDWMTLLGLEIRGGQMSCYAPPCSQPKWLARFSFMESAGDRWWPIAGGVYFLQGVKRVRGMRVITPKWSDRLVAGEKLVVMPKKVRDEQEPLAARTATEHANGDR
jgi:SAM-dependent methyltransferase